jgi:hypothetical protein
MLDSTTDSDFETVRNHTAKLIQDAVKKKEPALNRDTFPAAAKRVTRLRSYNEHCR